MSIFEDEFVPNIQTANKTSYGQWKQSNPKEAAKWEPFRDALYTYKKGDTLAVPALATKYGKALVAAGKQHMSVIDLGAEWNPPEPPPPPPPPANNYYSANFNQFTNPPFVTIQTYSGTGNYSSFPNTGTPDGRVTCVAAPDGVGRAWRFELRNGDLWPPNTSYMRSDLQWNGSTEWNQNGIFPGDIRWFDVEFYLPLGQFDFPRSNWLRMLEPHTGAPTWSCFSLISEGSYLSSNPAWMTLKLAGGTQGSTANLKYVPIFQFTNADGSWYTPNFNRRLRVRWGGLWASDFTGWYEVWVDNVNVAPRTYHPTMWTGDTGEYLKAGPYISASSSFPSGKCVFYITKLDIGYSMAP